MNITRKGKIARLPHAVREQLNRRLRDGELGKTLVQWLNGLPEVRAVLTREFNGKPIRQQSLSEWKPGGYADWLEREQASELAEKLIDESKDWEVGGGRAVTDILAFSLATRYALVIPQLDEARGRERWKLLHQMCGDIVELRRGDHSEQRLVLERERAAAQELDALTKWKRKIVLGMETLWKFVEKEPKAKAAFYELLSHVKHPLDPAESDVFRPNPTKSDQTDKNS